MYSVDSTIKKNEILQIYRVEPPFF